MEMVYVVKVVNIVGSLYSMMLAPQSQTSLASDHRESESGSRSRPQ